MSERAKQTTLSPIKTNAYFHWIAQSIPSMAFLVNVVVTSIKGNKIGNPKMANKVRLLPALDAIVLSMLRTKASPQLPKKYSIPK